ncbi:MAG: tetratricopeptide repeat protein [Lacunisphaera sp.]|nr:tetratricopeptide repeat protein [Lacunisphaera sp.]
MRVFVSFLLLVPFLGLVPAGAFAAKKEKPPADAPPQLISTKGGGPKWKNAKELEAFAAQGDPRACFELGMRLLEGGDATKSDPAKALPLLEQAAQGGVADAWFRLGKIYHDANGVPRDYAKALEYYTAAARLGVPEAQHNIGAMLVSARGVKRDYVEGLAWLILANKSGAGSDAETKVRERLAKRPADIRAAEARAGELLANLASATVRTGIPGAAALREPPKLPAPPATANPVVKPTISAPKFEPIAPPKITVPLDPAPPAPR